VTRRRGLAAGFALACAAAAGCGDADCDLYGSLRVSRTTFSEPMDAATRLRVESCRRDREACESLCLATMEKDQQLAQQELDCEVSFSARGVEVKVLHVDAEACRVSDVPLPAPEA
jgi:hypothetical protein